MSHAKQPGAAQYDAPVGESPQKVQFRRVLLNQLRNRLSVVSYNKMRSPLVIRELRIERDSHVAIDCGCKVAARNGANDDLPAIAVAGADHLTMFQTTACLADRGNNGPVAYGAESAIIDMTGRYLDRRGSDTLKVRQKYMSPWAIAQIPIVRDLFHLDYQPAQVPADSGQVRTRHRNRSLGTRGIFHTDQPPRWSDDG